MRIAFDIDDTILIPSVARDDNGGYNTPNHEVIAIYKWFQSQGHEMILWSGSGMDWAQTWGEKFGLMPFKVYPKELRMNCPLVRCEGSECMRHEYDVDMAFDDCDVDLAKVNIKVKRINNGISRAEWNKSKK